MALDRNLKARYFNEFVFAKVFRNMNEKKFSNSEKLTMVSEGRAMHQKMINMLPSIIQQVTPPDREVVIDEELQKKESFGAASPRAMKLALREVFGDYAPSDAEFNDMIREFGSDAGFESTKQDVGPMLSTPKLPLSPFDRKFEFRKTFRDAGSRMCYCDMKDVQDDGSFPENTMIYTDEGTDGFRKLGEAMVRDDKSGMTLLQNYMTQAEYQKCAPWVNSIGEDQYMDINSLRKAAVILRHLQSEGIDYEIVPDMNPGQLKVICSGRDLDIRLTDTKSNQNYVGRVFQQGRAMYYGTNMFNKETQTAVKYDPNPNDCVRLINYALGRLTPRTDSESSNRKYIGAPAVRGYGKYAQNESYFTKTMSFSTVAGKLLNEKGEDTNFKTMIFVEKPRAETYLYLGQNIKPEDFLKSSVDSAREQFQAGFDVDALIRAFREHEEPKLSQDESIARVQNTYWRILQGENVPLYRPGMYGDGASDFADMPPEEKQTMGYVGLSPEEMVRQHLKDSVDYYIGSYELDAEGKRFNPMAVSKYMISGKGEYSNSRELLQAARDLHLQPGEFKDSGNNSVSLWKDQLVYFNKDAAWKMKDIDHPVVKDAFDAIRFTLRSTGARIKDDDILMDENGIVHYSGVRIMDRSAAKVNEMPFEGEIGQIFLPDADGLVKTQFAGSDNYYFAPGYRAHVLPQKPGEDKSLEERTRLHGYSQELCDRIRYSLRTGMMERLDNVGSPTNLNQTYRRLYDSRFDLDFRERAKEERMPESLMNAIISTASRRVRYSSEIRDGSTINADYESSRREGSVLMDNDNYKDPYILTGRRNMALLSREGDGIFDISATGTAYNQGVTRYLNSDAQVSSKGELIQGSLDGKTPLMAHDVCKYMDYVPFDRRQMTFSNLTKASCITEPTKTAQMTFGGWTFDDGYVVSKNFAENYKIAGSDGKMRSLMIGDKISDMNGNKGVISLVVDPDMDMEEAKAQGLDQPVAWFKANPGLDVVGAPFAAPSRFNAGSARELMEHPEDLKSPDGKVFEGCMGSTHYIVTHMSVDEKTHVYTDDELAQGRGRRVSAQLAWAFASQGAHSIMRECYGNNDNAVLNYRELLNVMGLDMDPTGVLHHSYQPHEGEERQVFKLPELQYVERTLKSGEKKLNLNTKAMRDQFLKDISHEGGVMELPFPLTFPNGDATPPMELNKKNVKYIKSEWEVKPRYDEDGNIIRKGYIAHRNPDANTERGGKETYGLPVLSSKLRTGQDNIDGSVVIHDYTKQYTTIFDKAIQYMDAEKAGDTAKMETLQSQAQAAYDKMTNDLKTKVFTGKHNYIKEHIMSARMPNSATAVWTADPRLGIDQIAMGRGMAESIGIEDNTSVLVWRDPMLRDAGCRYMRVKIDDNLHGCAINPVMDKGFDGDFDGDSVGILRLTTPAAQREALSKMSVQANMLDFGALGSDGKYKLMMQDGLDLKSAQWARPELKQQWDELTDRANRIFVDENGREREQVDIHAREALSRDLNLYVQNAFSQEYGTDMVSFKDMKSHMQSIEHMVIDGAKGNHNKLKDYAKYMGISYEMKPVEEQDVDRFLDNVEQGLRKFTDSCIDLDTIEDHKKSLANRDDDLDVQYATAVKSFGTGIAGMYSQRGMSVLRNECPKAVLELTYPVTQGILQAKHDPIQARHMYELLKGPVRNLWQGNKLEEVQRNDGSVTWKVARDENGKPLAATPDEFKKQFMDVYTSKNGLGVSINPHYIDDISKVLTDPESGRMMDIEKTAKEKIAAPMDKLAYGGDFKTLCDVAAKRENLYAGKENGWFAPRTIWMNAKAVRENEKTEQQGDNTRNKREVRALVQKDTQKKTAKSMWDRYNQQSTEQEAENQSEATVAVVMPPVEVVDDTRTCPAD